MRTDDPRKDDPRQDLPRFHIFGISVSLVERCCFVRRYDRLLDIHETITVGCQPNESPQYLHWWLSTVLLGRRLPVSTRGETTHVHD